MTVRAELSRLRPLLGDVVLLSRPYRLVGPLETDVDAVRRCLVVGNAQSDMVVHGRLQCNARREWRAPETNLLS